MKICQITIGCENIVEGRTDGCASCNHAARKAERNANKIVIAKPVAKVSDKRAGQLKEYYKLQKEYLALYPVCEVEECNIKSTEVHHQRGREGERLLDTNFFMAVCVKHHREMTEHSKEAIEQGYSYSRISKQDNL